MTESIETPLERNDLPVERGCVAQTEEEAWENNSGGGGRENMTVSSQWGCVRQKEEGEEKQQREDAPEKPPALPVSPICGPENVLPSD